MTGLGHRASDLGDRGNVGAVIGLGQLRSNTGGYLERVLAGEALEVVRRGILVGRVLPADNDRPVPRSLPDHVAANGADGRVGLVALRTRAGRIFDRVAAGETIWIVWHDKLVARIVSVDPAQGPIARRARNAGQDPAGPVELTQLRTRAAHYFDRVAAGETIEVARRGRVAARIVSIEDSAGCDRMGRCDFHSTICGQAKCDTGGASAAVSNVGRLALQQTDQRAAAATAS